MHLPNYKDGSIVNLSSSIMKAYGSSTPYKPLPSLDIGALTKIEEYRTYGD